MEKDVIEVADEDFGIWYVDAYDHPDRYLNKEILFKSADLPTEGNGGPYVCAGPKDHDLLRG